MKIATVKMVGGSVFRLWAKHMEVLPTMIVGVTADTNEGIVIPLDNVFYMVDGKIHDIEETEDD